LSATIGQEGGRLQTRAARFCAPRTLYLTLSSPLLSRNPPGPISDGRSGRPDGQPFGSAAEDSNVAYPFCKCRSPVCPDGTTVASSCTLSGQAKHGLPRRSWDAGQSARAPAPPANRRSMPEDVACPMKKVIRGSAATHAELVCISNGDAVYCPNQQLQDRLERHLGAGMPQPMPPTAEGSSIAVG
jgi:hypothetical protein